MFCRSLYLLITYLISDLPTPPQFSSAALVSKNKVVCSWGPQRQELFSTLRESLSEMSEISNFVENCSERPQSEESSQKTSAMICRNYIKCTYVLFHLFV